MHPSVKHLCYTIAVLVLLTRAASGGVLFGHASALLSGNEKFTGVGGKLSANVDYAVFSKGVFTGALGLPAAEDPSGGTQYVYAYEVFNTGVSILSFSVGLQPNVITAATNWGDAPSAGGAAASLTLSGFFPGASPIGAKTNVKWHFSTLIAATSGHSKLLLFTSPYSPGLDTASFSTLVGDTNPSFTDYVPSPVVPEPSTFVLSGLAAFGLLTAGYLRRRRV